MRKQLAAGAAALAVAAVTACSGGSGSSVAGISSSKCTMDWSADTQGAPFFSTQAAAQAWVNANASGDGSVYDDNPAPVERYASLSVTASQAIGLGTVTVAFYSSSGTELNSATTSDIDQTITAGQTWTSPDGELSAPDSAATCQVVSWTPDDQ